MFISYQQQAIFARNVKTIGKTETKPQENIRSMQNVHTHIHMPLSAKYTFTLSLIHAIIWQSLRTFVQTYADTYAFIYACYVVPKKK